MIKRDQERAAFNKYLKVFIIICLRLRLKSTSCSQRVGVIEELNYIRLYTPLSLLLCFPSSFLKALSPSQPATPRSPSR